MQFWVSAMFTLTHKPRNTKLARWLTKQVFPWSLVMRIFFLVPVVTSTTFHSSLSTSFVHFSLEWKKCGCASESYAADLAKTVSIYPPKASAGISAASSLKSEMSVESPAVSQTDQVPLFGLFVTGVEDASLNRRVLSLFHDAKL